jgi:hypothetical protein
VVFSSSSGINAAGTAILGSGDTEGEVISITIDNPGTGYQTAPAISFVGGGGSLAAAIATIKIDIDKVDSFGDNNSFKTEAQDILFSASNPFGEIDVKQ